MPGSEGIEKKIRTIEIYDMFRRGEDVRKDDLAKKYNVTERSIQRDIDSVRAYLAYQKQDKGVNDEVVFDRKRMVFKLNTDDSETLTDQEILMISKILLSSRAVPKAQMEIILKKLLSVCSPGDGKRLIDDMMRNEMFHYVETKHSSNYSDVLWNVAKAINTSSYVMLSYKRLAHEPHKEERVMEIKIQPLAILFSEYYFYVLAFAAEKKLKEHFDLINDAQPNIYRVDRIENVKIMSAHFHIPYRDKFEEGEFRKRIQFMQGGKLHKVSFMYYGPSIDIVLDRLPTAKAKKVPGREIYYVDAEVYGDGVDDWLKSIDAKISLNIGENNKRR